MKIRFNPFLASLAALAAMSSVHAASVTWNVAGGGTWNTSTGNWSGGSPTANLYVNGDTANFTNTAGGAISLSGSIAPAATNISAASGTYTFSGTGITSGTLTKTGAGNLILQNSNSHAGLTTVNGGKITVSGSGALTGTGALSVGILNPAVGIFQYDSNASSSFSTITLGSNTNGNGTLNQTSGQITASELRMSTVFSGNVGTVNLSGGTLNITGNASVGERASGAGGGASNVNVSASGILQVDGSLTLGGGVGADNRHGTGVLTQTGGSVTISSGLVFTRTADATFTRRGTYNLDGGTLNVNQISQAAAGTGTQTGTFNFNGGTLKPTANSATFMQSLTTANVKDGGANIDTNGKDITIGQSLIKFAGSTTDTLTKSGNGTLTLSGTSISTYTGNTLVSAGTLLVNGALGNTAVTVDPTATVGGTGSLGGSLAFAGTSNLHVVDFNDPLAVTGSVTFGSGFGIDNLLGINWDSLDLHTAYTVLSTTQSFGTGDIANFGYDNRVTVGSLGREAYFQNGSLQVIVIPEPSAALLGGLGMLVLLRRRRA